MVYGEQDSLGYLSNMGVFGKYNMVFFITAAHSFEE